MALTSRVLSFYCLYFILRTAPIPILSIQTSPSCALQRNHITSRTYRALTNRKPHPPACILNFTNTKHKHAIYCLFKMLLHRFDCVCRDGDEERTATTGVCLKLILETAFRVVSLVCACLCFVFEISV